ncbi:uncharacterized protein LOC126857453 [Cataglyphis hispanica]|uniref:uncharacterized protein LOC126857453 n=1 Tax=Cataglyphis hispanica TaxID=1086592 RepID=UPI00218079F4|nr:uncharacterized protein LOC126857453 [Cataglyphis hispanica]XP_050462852.1 uncharacterized protein LOC126857453 [Cataglyphis hispanica]XP_050462853.1 uncharacterized protein LOC126857453 [Cataglyphis hispanica]XP_050462854.1 uncharacterized protein LOC126857453 [Cataglyphis hispanica]
MTENVYVIKIKTKPPLSSLYPSERRYSASTVGGMSLIHLILGAISLFLSTIAVSVPGHILSLACLVPSVTGCLAWRRWYIDRNISIFFYGSLFSSAVGIFCGVVMIYDLTVILNAEESQSLKILDASRHPISDFTNNTQDITSKGNPKFIEDHNSSKVDKVNKSLVTLEPFELNVFEERMMISKSTFQDDDTMNITGSVNMKERNMAIWHRREFDPNLNGIQMAINVITASCLEVLWSLLSAQIAFNGMMNLPESANVAAGSKTTKLPLPKRKPPAPKPDILNHDHRLSESLQNFTTLQGLAGLGARLPLPESSREFRERVERFLANQATHRVVESA